MKRMHPMSMRIGRGIDDIVEVVKKMQPDMEYHKLRRTAETMFESSFKVAQEYQASTPLTNWRNPLLHRPDLDKGLRELLENNCSKLTEQATNNRTSQLMQFFTISGVTEEHAREIVEWEILGLRKPVLRASENT